MQLPSRGDSESGHRASLPMVAAVLVASLMLASGLNATRAAEVAPGFSSGDSVAGAPHPWIGSRNSNSGQSASGARTGDAGPAGETRDGHQSTPTRYPTPAEVYYVLACMQVNGQNAEGMRRCSCTVNALEARLSYDQFRDAQIVVALRQGGRNAAIFRDTAPMQAVVSGFTSAQEAANGECFGNGSTVFKQSAPGRQPSETRSSVTHIGAPELASSGTRQPRDAQRSSNGGNRDAG